MNMPSSPLSALRFDNSFIRELPGDPQQANSVRQVHGACYSKVTPTRVGNPKLICYAPEVAHLLDLTDNDCHSQLFTEVFAGNTLLPGMEPYAMCYGGHQFGNWAGQLGDGRAINLGEIINSQQERWVLQLKGAGPTPYSRRADGLAVLRSSVREFLCSEAMHHLGVPTTRALSLITTGEDVLRDMFYDGNPQLEPGAVVCRVSPSFTRFGNFEIFAARQDTTLLRQLVEYTIRVDFPHLPEPSTETLLRWFAEVCGRTATLMVHWLRVGFVHGVMNTDNMSILGLTIDYGPYGWLEDYDPTWTPNTTDSVGRRYSFGNQAAIAYWNLTQFANAILPLVGDPEPLQEILEHDYRQAFLGQWRTMMAHKLGFGRYLASHDEQLVNDLLALLQQVETDMTLFFRGLAEITPPSGANGVSTIPPALLAAYYQPDQLDETYQRRLNEWLHLYHQRQALDDEPPFAQRVRMQATNPCFVLRNYLSQQAIEQAEAGDPTMIHELFELLREPYVEQPEKERYYQKRPEWARHKAGAAMLS